MLDVQRQWVESQKPAPVAEGQPVAERPKALPDADAEELRQVLYSDRGRGVCPRKNCGGCSTGPPATC